MSGYDFSQLNDRDFEELVADLLSEREQKNIECFKAGKDGGIDGRLICDGETIVIQCKHYLKSGLTKLLYKLEKEEQKKVRKLNPSRYIFVTSLGLNVNDKNKILEIFSPYIRSSSDVLGCDDLNQLLRKCPDIQKAHYKLWLSSTAVLEGFINNAVVGRSRFVATEILEGLKDYVVTSQHQEAINKIESLKTLIVTGEPGVGKTTLAKAVCAHYINEGYSFYCIEGSISEAEDVISPGKKQVFYFDDFLGDVLLTAVDKKDGSNIVGFIRRIRASKNKRFVLTSRSNILNRAKMLTSKFKENNTSRNEYEISVEDFSLIDKAKILYSLMYRGEIDSRHIRELYKERRYLKIIKQKSYNPRIIEFATDGYKAEEANVSLNNYWEYVWECLQNPADVWEHPYRNQLTSNAQDLVCLLSLFNSTEVTEDDLAGAFKRAKPESNHVDFLEAARILTGSFVRRDVGFLGSVTYRLINPSIKDFILHRIKNDSDVLIWLLMAINEAESVGKLIRYTDNFVPDEIAVELICKVLDRYPNKYRDATDVVIKIADSASCRFFNNENVTLVYDRFLSKVNLRAIETKCVSELASIACDGVTTEVIPQSALDDFVVKYVPRIIEGSDFDQFYMLASLAADPNSLQKFISQQAISFLEDNITDYVESDYVFDGIYEIDDPDIESKFGKYVESIVSDWGKAFSSVDNDKLLEFCEIDSIIDSNRENYMDDVYSQDHMDDCPRSESTTDEFIVNYFGSPPKD